MNPKPNQFITQAEFAKLRGSSKFSVTHWKQLGLLVMKGRLVDVAASEKLLDARPISKRGRGTNRRPDAAPVAPALAEVPPEVLEATPAKVLTSAANWTTAEANRRKEIALALTRQLEYDLKSGAVVQIADVRMTVETEYAVVRDRILQAPSKLADRLLDCPDRHEIEKVIRAELYEALSALADRAAVQ
jgi:hypothetical protein